MEEKSTDPQILVIGESLIDIVQREGEKPQSCPGGSPMNVAIGLGRLGHSPTLATWFAQDKYGKMITKHCEESRVTILPGSDQAPRTSTAMAQLDEHGHATYTFDIDMSLPVLPEAIPPLIHIGSLGALLQPARDVVLPYCQRAQDTSMIFFDPNVRPSIMGSPDTVRPVVEEYIRTSTVVKVSDEDLAWLYPSPDIFHAHAKRWLEGGTTRLVVVTLGSKGARALTAQSEFTVPAHTTSDMVDTVGAGDSFMAGLISETIACGYLEKSLGLELGEEPEIVEYILQRASQVAGITVSRAGANPPWHDELDRKLT
ncbi:MAG: carbohydrate kinase [Propionibacteriaceae bacterium]|nr:carbohydrate kinase [Propionibacteriaceae bacterium]